MNAVYNKFIENIESIRVLGNIYDQNILQYPILEEVLSDILRFQFLYSVSALDRFIHEIVKKEMVKNIVNNNQLTDKAEDFKFSLKTVNKILTISKNNSMPITQEDTIEYWIEKEILDKHKLLAFQSPDKISDALSNIWDENDKWKKIVSKMTIQFNGNNDTQKANDLKQRIKVITERRNQIVHEADIDVVSQVKRTIDKSSVAETINIVEDLGKSIYKCLNPNATT